VCHEYNMWTTGVVIVLCLAIGISLVSLVKEQDLRHDGTFDIELFDTSYDLVTVDAPVLSGWPLEIFAKIATRSPLSPLIMRFLINDHKLHLVRDFAAQIPEMPPLYYPMKRLTSEAKAQLEAELSSELERNALQAGLGPTSEASAAGYFTIQDYFEAYSGKRMTPTDAMEAVIRGAERLDEKLRIFSSFHKEDVLDQARESEARWKAGKPLSVMDGVPVVIKDMINVKGHNIYNGGSVPVMAEVDDEIVRRLRAHGAIIFGVTVMTEGGVTPLGYNAHFDGPFNPYNMTYYSGGSSSGNAVAVAAGLVPVSIGFDGGGSIRLPSAMSGIFGLATGFARIPFDLALGCTMIKAGPMAASAADAAITYAAIADQPSPDHFYAQIYDGGDQSMPSPTLAKVTQIDDLKDVRIGVYWEWFEDADDEVVRKCKDALGKLVELGATVVNITIPHLRIMSMAHSTKISSEFALFWDMPSVNKNHKLEANTAITVALGKAFTATEILAGQVVRNWAMHEVEQLYAENDLDVIMSPTMGNRVPEIPKTAMGTGENNTPLVLQVMKYIFLANLLGLPGMATPVGYDTKGLPISAHVMAPHWREHQVLRLSMALEKYFLHRKSPAQDLFFNLRDELNN